MYRGNGNSTCLETDRTASLFCLANRAKMVMLIWNWIRFFINRAEILQILVFLLRFLVAVESPGTSLIID